MPEGPFCRDSGHIIQSTNTQNSNKQTTKQRKVINDLRDLSIIYMVLLS